MNYLQYLLRRTIVETSRHQEIHLYLYKEKPSNQDLFILDRGNDLLDVNEFCPVTVELDGSIKINA